MEMQLERDALQYSRQKELQSQENLQIQSKNSTEELEAASQQQDKVLREGGSQNEHLTQVVHEELLLEVPGLLMDCKDRAGRKPCDHGDITSLLTHSLSTAFHGVLQDLDSQVSHLKGKLILVEEELRSLTNDSQTQREQLPRQHQMREQARTPNLVHPHQICHLESTVCQLCSLLGEVKRIYENKVKDLEKQLQLAHSETAEAQTDRAQHGQESGNPNDRIHQLLTELRKKETELSLEKERNKRFWDQNTENSLTMEQLRRQLDNRNMQLQSLEKALKEMRMECRRQIECQMAAIEEKNESIGRISSLTVQLEMTKEALRKVTEDLAAKQKDLEAAEQTGSGLVACLQEKERALGASSQEIRELRSQLGSRMQELQHVRSEEGCLCKVQSECEVLKLRVLEKERMVEIFQKQIDNMTQIMGQHGQTAGAMEVEKSQLKKEINDWKLKAEELKSAKDEKEARIRAMEARLSELELEKVQLVSTCTKRLQALNDAKLEKDKLLQELQAGQRELAGLAETFEDLKRNYQGEIKEMENTANRLKMQLESAQAELKQARTALKTMEGFDGNGLEAAARMQKQITAKRGQIDALQSKIKFLEEAMANAAKEKLYLREENSKLSQKLSCIKAENIRISGDLEILRSQDKQLKEKLSKMEKALDKVRFLLLAYLTPKVRSGLTGTEIPGALQASLQFAECQSIIQCQEQEVMRCRLQHTLDVRELQGPGYSSASGKLHHIVPLSHLHSAVQPHALHLPSSAPQNPSKLDILKEEPLQDLKRILQELTSSDSNVPSVDLSSRGGRKSPLTAMRNAVGPSCSHHFLLTDLPSQNVSLLLTSLGNASTCSAAPRYTSSPKQVPREAAHRARSPVHLLLTTPPGELAAGPAASPKHSPAPGKLGSPQGTATAPQIASRPIDISDPTPKRLQNKMKSLQNLVESSQIKKQATSPTIRTREVKTKKSKEKEGKLSK